MRRLPLPGSIHFPAAVGFFTAHRLRPRPLLSRDGSALACDPARQSEPAQDPAPDYRIEIRKISGSLRPKKKIRTSAYNGQIPGSCST